MQAATSEPVPGKASGNVFHAWLSLFRLPNLFSVPGDVIAGYLLASQGALATGRTGFELPALAGASVCLYSSGLIMNDLFDLARDRAERPERPLASGRISPRRAFVVALVLNSTALALAFSVGILPFVVAAILMMLALFYNARARRWPAIGFLTMGLCRGTNLFLGASAALPSVPGLVLAAGAVEVAYITAVTATASLEVSGQISGVYRWSSPVILTAGLAFLVAQAGASWPGIVSGLLAVGTVFAAALALRPGLPARARPQQIGALVHALSPVQAAFVLIGCAGAAGSGAAAATIYSFWFLSRLASIRFKGS